MKKKHDSDALFFQDFLNKNGDHFDLFAELIPQLKAIWCRLGAEGKVYSGKDPGKLQQGLFPQNLFTARGEGLPHLLQEFFPQLLTDQIHLYQPSTLAHLHCPVMNASLVADFFIHSMNQSMDSWDQAPLATLIEQKVVDDLCTQVGYQSGDGVFTSGGTQSNLMGLFYARDWALLKKESWSLREQGVSPRYRDYRAYTSACSHFSVKKGLHLLGMGEQQLVTIPVNEKFQMDTELLKSQIAADRKAGKIPFLIVGTFGTTDFGSLDPLDELAQVAQAEQMWLHVDACYGGGLLFVNPLSTAYEPCHLLKNADSIALDFHKMLFQSISCSAFLMKDQELFALTKENNAYLNRKEDEAEGIHNLVNKSLQTTRSFDALKVYLSFLWHGREWFEVKLQELLDLTQDFKQHLQQDPDFQVLAGTDLHMICFQFCPQQCYEYELQDLNELNRSIRKVALHSGAASLGETSFGGSTYLKLTLIHPLITRDQLMTLKEAIKKIGNQYVCKLITGQ